MTIDELFQSMQLGELILWGNSKLRIISIGKDCATFDYIDVPGTVQIQGERISELKKLFSAYDYIMSERFYNKNKLCIDVGVGVLDTFLERYGDKLKDIY